MGKELYHSFRHARFAAKGIRTANNFLDQCRQSKMVEISEVFRYIAQQNVARYLEKVAQKVEDFIKELHSRVASLRDQHRFIVTWKWRRALRDQIQHLRF